jgi:hypothetical protein
MHLIASNHLEWFPDHFLERFPHINKLHDAVYNHPKVKEFYPPKVATTLWFTAKEGELDKFTQVYTDNPFRVISTSKDSPLYTIGQSTGSNMQGTFVLWKNAKERDVVQNKEELKKAVEAVKNCGHLGASPAVRNFPVQLEIRPSAKPVKGNCGAIHLLRAKILPGKGDEFVKAFTHGVAYLRNPDHVIRYFGGIDPKENEWNGVIFFTTPDSANIVGNCEARVKLLQELKPLLAGEIQNLIVIPKSIHEI